MCTLSISKFRATITATALAVASLSPASHAQAQTAKARVDVPFAFEYGSHHFDAGRYTLSTNAGPIMSIQGRSRSAAVMTQAEIDAHPAKSGKVVFQKYGTQYFLREVWTEGSATHVHCLQSKAERQAERQLIASSHSAPTGVELAVLQMPR